MRLRVRWGRRSTPGGWSHSWVTPTSASARPSAPTSSVNEGKRLTIRIGARPFSGRGPSGRGADVGGRADRDHGHRQERPPVEDAPEVVEGDGGEGVELSGHAEVF